MNAANQILDIEFRSKDLRKKITVRKFLVQLLMTLWDEEESFSGKRPFGNSGWKSDLEIALIRAGAVAGTIVHGFVDDIDYDAFDKAIHAAIKAL